MGPRGVRLGLELTVSAERLAARGQLSTATCHSYSSLPTDTCVLDLHSDSNFLAIRSCVLLGSAPAVEGWRCELTPVDFAAQALLGVAFLEPQVLPNGCLCLLNGCLRLLSGCLRLLNGCSDRVALLEPQHWAGKRFNLVQVRSQRLHALVQRLPVSA